jgi:pilus assembly protein Flp/PilA
MLELLVKTQSLLRDRKGATAIEYGLIAAGIAIAIVGVLATVGTDLSGLFDKVSGNLK